MKTLNRYLTQDFLVTFGMTLAVFTLVMCVGVVIKAIDVAARGISVGLIVKFFALNIPFMMTFSIPMSTLTAVLLVFGRMSFDGEITAMKASGISLWQIVAPILMLSVAFSLICLSINTSIAPQCRTQFRTLLAEISTEDPINLLEPGRFVRDFPGHMVYVREREGRQVRDIVVYQLGTNGPQKNIRAETGTIEIDEASQIMMVRLFNVRIDAQQVDKETGEVKTHYVQASEYPVPFDLSKAGRKIARKKVGDMEFFDVLRAIRFVRQDNPELEPRDLARQRMMLAVEANKRLALSMSCFGFTLLGVTLGMKSKRRESSIGVLVSLLLVLAFYLFIIIANSLVGKPDLRPDLIVWIPVLISQAMGFTLIHRAR